jgi:DNA-binding NarL/FixJ family response regulator
MATLTARECEVMALALKGLPSKVIAKELSISHRTVEQHRSRVLEKLGVGSVTELMRLTFDRPDE